MIRVIKQTDLKMLIELFKDIRRIDKDEIKNIYYNMNKSKIVVGNVEGERLTSLLIANLINNDYYLEDFIFINNDINEVKDLLAYMKHVLYEDQRGLSIIYTNIPYSETMDTMLKNEKFKCDYINFVNDNINRIELIRNNVVINEVNDEVNAYMLDHYNAEYRVICEYFGEIKKVSDVIDASRTNIAVAKNSQQQVIGVARFGIVADSVFINCLYGDTDEVIVDLINLVKNLTNRKIEIGIYPVRDDLNRVLLENGFVKNHADYIYKF